MYPDDDRSSINTKRSGYTNLSIVNECSAFDPANIDPERGQAASGEEVLESGDEGNPLEVTLVNREISRTLDPIESVAQKRVIRARV